MDDNVKWNRLHAKPWHQFLAVQKDRQITRPLINGNIYKLFSKFPLTSNLLLRESQQ
jgi:hypothetical protein